MIIFGSELHGKLVARASGCAYDPDVNFCVSIAKAELLGGVIYTNYTGRSVQMHQAAFARYWATPQFMFCIYDFPFNVLKVERVIATVPSTNERAMSITQKMGFNWVTTVPGAVPGGDLEILSMLRHECKYLKLGWRYAAVENAA